MAHLKARLTALGIELPQPAPVKGSYRRVVVHGDIAYVSGSIAVLADPPRVAHVGAVGAELTAEEARESARLALLGVIASLGETLGDVDRIHRFLHIGGFVRTAPGYQKISAVIGGASSLIEELFGADGLAARTAVGVAELPDGASVMIDATVSVAA